MVAGKSVDLAGESTSVLEGTFKVSVQTNFNLFNLLCLIAFAYCVVKIFFQNIKRGGILLIQMAVGSLYMFSVPRGYTDGFVQWMKQVAAICLTAFLQTSILYLGLLTFPDNMLNMYGRYNPYEDTLSIECEIDREEGSSYFDYIPTNAESQLMKDLITEKIHEVYHQTPKEFCEDAFDNGIGIGEMQ